ncbi:MAG: apolipoprotein N-acyltransferase [Nitrospirota bacterium]
MMASSRAAWGLALGSGAALALSFPLTESFAGLQPIAWLALAPLGLAVLTAPPRRAFLLGWLAGTAAYLAILAWVVIVMHTYGHLPMIVSWALLALLAAYVGLYVGLFALGWRWLAARWPRGSWLLAPAFWVALEWLRGHLLSGFPWALFGYSQYRQLALIQLAELTGVYGVSFLLVWVNVGFTHLLLATLKAPAGCPRSLPRYAPLLVAAVVVAAAVGWGHWRRAAVEASLEPGLRVGLIQGNIPQAMKWDPAMRRETLERYERLTRRAAEQGAELIVWPEASAPFFFEEEPDYQQAIRALAAETGRSLLFGSPAVAQRDGEIRLLNSAYLLNPDGATQARYDKLHLVPFGEYVPLGPLLGFVNKLVVGIGDFIPGPGPVLMEAAGRPLGVVICFEIIFPEVVRQFPLNGARIIATITNDAWFGRSAAPLQHFSMAVFRAIEHRTPVIRAANTGISGVIGATGRIGNRSALFVEAALVEPVAVSPIRTFYTRAGDIFAVGCGILIALFIIIGRTRTRRGIP